MEIDDFLYNKEPNENGVQEPIEEVLEQPLINGIDIKGKYEEKFDNDNLLLYEGLEQLIDYLQKKYENKNIYSLLGENILISINPYCDINNTKHLNEMINNSIKKMLKTKIRQNFIINGESGSGKTETAKIILKTLTSSNNDEISRNIMDSNPILEAFGNAKTIINDNSSRFIKFIDINFSEKGQILDANISCYLLEKSRVVKVEENEENFKIFYQLLLGKNEEEEKKYKIKPIDYYKYLNNKKIEENEEQKKLFEETKNCLDNYNFSKEDKDNVFKILVGILYLGNIEFISKKNKENLDIADIVDNKSEDLEIASELFGLTKDELIKILTTKKSNKITVPYNKEEAENAKDSIAKELYSKLFNYIIDTINNKIKKNDNDKDKDNDNNKYQISILDIYGFENFEINSLEQLNINYSNERLQQYFINAIFISEIKIYNEEGIKYDKDKMIFDDNQNKIDTIHKIFDFLKDTFFQKSEEGKKDKSFRQKVYDELIFKSMNIRYSLKPTVESDTLKYVQKETNSLYIKHYAETVKYIVDGMTKKSQLNSNNEIIETLQKSNNALIKKLYEKEETKEHDTLNKKTLSLEFKNKLTSLFKKKFDNFDNKFIKCIKPNVEKKENLFNKTIVEKQIKYLGIEDAFNMIKIGYPIKKKKEDFIKEYKLLFPQINIESFDENIENEMKKIGNNKFNDLYTIGKTYFFMKEDLKNSLNRIINEKLIERNVKIFNLIIKQSIKNCINKINLFSKLKKYSDIIDKSKSKYWLTILRLKINEKKEREEKERKEREEKERKEKEEKERKEKEEKERKEREEKERKEQEEKERKEKEEKEKEEKENEKEEKDNEKEEKDNEKNKILTEEENLFNINKNNFNPLTPTNKSIMGKLEQIINLSQILQNDINQVYKDHKTKLEEENNKLKSQKEQFKKEKEEMVKKNEELKKENEELKKEKEEMRKKNEELEKKNEELIKEKEEIEKKNEELEKKKEEVEKNLKEIEKFIGNIRNLY